MDTGISFEAVAISKIELHVAAQPEILGSNKLATSRQEQQTQSVIRETVEVPLKPDDSSIKLHLFRSGP